NAGFTATSMFTSGTWGNWLHQWDADLSVPDQEVFLDNSSVAHDTVRPTGVVDPDGFDADPDTKITFGNVSPHLGNAYSMDGSLSDFAVWNRILTADEKNALQQGFSPGCFPKGLILHRPFIRLENRDSQYNDSHLLGVALPNTQGSP